MKKDGLHMPTGMDQDVVEEFHSPQGVFPPTFAPTTHNIKVGIEGKVRVLTSSWTNPTWTCEKEQQTLLDKTSQRPRS